MKAVYPEIKIFDNNRKEMKFKKKIINFREYSTHYNLQYLKGSTNKQRHPQFSNFHRIQTNLSICEIRNHKEITFFLKQSKIKINDHEWDEKSTRISNLGFCGGVDPGNYTRQQFESDIRKQIAAANSKQESKIPKFKCRFSSPFMYIESDNVDEPDRRLFTKACNLEVRQRDAKEMIKLLQKIYQTNPTFMFHRTRHDAPNVYSNVIHSQNKYLNNTRTVLIVGISRQVMFYLQPELFQISGVSQVLEHSRTDTKGRYSVMTTLNDFSAATKTIRTKLLKTVSTISELHSLLLNSLFSEVSVTFKSIRDDESSDRSMQSYLSACSTV